MDSPYARGLPGGCVATPGVPTQLAQKMCWACAVGGVRPASLGPFLCTFGYTFQGFFFLFGNGFDHKLADMRRVCAVYIYIRFQLNMRRVCAVYIYRFLMFSIFIVSVHMRGGYAPPHFQSVRLMARRAAHRTRDYSQHAPVLASRHIVCC